MNIRQKGRESPALFYDGLLTKTQEKVEILAKTTEGVTLSGVRKDVAPILSYDPEIQAETAAHPDDE